MFCELCEVKLSRYAACGTCGKILCNICTYKRCHYCFENNGVSIDKVSLLDKLYNIVYEIIRLSRMEKDQKKKESILQNALDKLGDIKEVNDIIMSEFNIISPAFSPPPLKILSQENKQSIKSIIV